VYDSVECEIAFKCIVRNRRTTAHQQGFVTMTTPQLPQSPADHVVCCDSFLAVTVRPCMGNGLE